MEIDPYFVHQIRPSSSLFYGRRPLSYHQPRSITLPEEILKRIFNHLTLPSADEQGPNIFSSNDCREKVDTLINLSLASKTFNRIAEPILYKTYFALPCPQAFLAALYANPHRISDVKELVLPQLSSTVFSSGPYNYAANLRMLEADNAFPVLLRLCTAVEVLNVAICKEYPGSRTERAVEAVAYNDYNEPLPSPLKRVVVRRCSATCSTVPRVDLLDQFLNVEEKSFAF
jgi:hypothetical protein